MESGSGSDGHSDGDVLAYRRLASELLDRSHIKRFHGDWKEASRLRYRSIVMYYEARPYQLYKLLSFFATTCHSHPEQAVRDSKDCV
ncbi:hypothetical protein PInf_007538 [Phytophthora infestans]|nr:hypothetical protein PInf_007538 [Phytophthora infestans]